MGDILRKIEEIEYEMSKTQKNKATAGHLGMLKAKLAKLRSRARRAECLRPLTQCC